MTRILSRFEKRDWTMPIRLEDQPTAFTHNGEQRFFWLGWHDKQGLCWLNRVGGWTTLGEDYQQMTRRWLLDGWLLPDGQWISCGPACHSRVAERIIWHNTGALPILHRLGNPLDNEDDNPPTDPEQELISCGWLQVRNTQAADGHATLTPAQALALKRGYA